MDAKPVETKQLVEHARALKARIQPYGVAERGLSRSEGAKAQVCEFLRLYAGPKSSFTAEASNASGHDSYVVAMLTSILDSYIEFLSAGLSTGVSPETKAQLDVVSEIMQQAQALLEQAKMHPAAPTVLIGASLEEFLRTWVEREGLSIGNAKPGMDAYAKVLREADKLTKQDIKDITSWSGLRNHAAHGEWDLVSDRRQVDLMLQGVNLFMRKYGP
jgi:hypothetical protein